MVIISALPRRDLKLQFRLLFNRCFWLLLVMACGMPGHLVAADTASPNTFLIWDNLSKTTNVPVGLAAAHLTFSFTNVSTGDVTITNVRPSCGCTTAQLPKLPWAIAAGTNGQIGVTVNLAGKSGTLVKTVRVSSDKAMDTLMVTITLVPLPGTPDPERMENLNMATADRQAVFKGNCASCHLTPGEGKSGKALFDAVCAICHESEHRATMVPDLQHLNVPTDPDFWHTWITYGKPGSLMPAFSVTQGGPLTEAQVTSLTNYLATSIPSKSPLPPGHRAPPK